MTRHLLPAAAILALLVGTPIPGNAASSTQSHFDREQMMILNCNRGPGSSGWLIVEALKQSRAAIKELDKSRRQLEQVDAAYAKYRGKPDSRYMETSVQKIKAAEETALQLESQLKDAYEDLKGSIQQTLITP
jgi:hypothetical protein